MERDVTAAQGYFLGAFLFLGIVFSLPATLGMASLALNLPVRCAIAKCE